MRPQAEPKLMSSRVSSSSAYTPICCRVALNYNWKSIRHVEGLVKISGFIFRSLSSVLKVV